MSTLNRCPQCSGLYTRESGFWAGLMNTFFAVITFNFIVDEISLNDDAILPWESVD